MKTIGKILTTLTLTATLSIGAAFAQSPTDNASYFPANTTMLFELDFSQESIVKDLVMFAIQASIANTGPATYLTGSEQNLRKELIMEIIENNRFSVSLQSPDNENEETILVASVTEDQMERVRELQQELKEETSSTTETYQNKELLTSGGTTVFLHNEKFVLTDSPETAKKVVDVIMGSSPSLANSASYQKLIQPSLENAFLHMYINLENITDDASFSTSFQLLEAMYGSSDIFTAEDIQISQFSEGFKALVNVQGDQQIMQKANQAFNKYDFVPSMYQKVAGENIMLYSEFNNLTGLLNDFVTGEAYNEWKAEVKETSDISIDKDVLPLMAGKGAFAMHEADSVCPGVTFYFDVSGNSNAAAILTALNLKLKNHWQSSLTAQEYEYRIDSINGTAFYTHAFLLPENPFLKEIPLRMAVKNNLLIISTHANLEELLTGDSMADNPEFAQLFTSQSEKVSDLQYLSFKNIRDYVLSVKAVLENSEDTPAQIPEILDLIAELLKPWKDALGTTVSQPYFATGQATIRVDINGFTVYPALFQKITDIVTEAFSSSYSEYNLEEYIPSSDQTFCDVPSSSWYYPYVMALSQSGVVKGYSDGCFHPGSDVTRAEFLKMALEQQATSTGTAFRATNATKTFTDVPATAWFGSYVNTAANSQYVQGYPDNSFKPNATITRAEAVQILYSINSKPASAGTLAFRDVNSADWFYSAILWAKNTGIVNGTTPFTFEPHKNLNRAEAAALVYAAW